MDAFMFAPNVIGGSDAAWMLRDGDWCADAALQGVCDGLLRARSLSRLQALAAKFRRAGWEIDTTASKQFGSGDDSRLEHFRNHV